MITPMRLAIAAVFAGMALAGPAQADTRTLHAKQLVLSQGGASDGVSIRPDASLSGQVRISTDDGLDCLSIVEGDTLVLETSRCGDTALRIDVPPGLPIVLNVSGSATVRLGDVGGPLTVNASGSGDLSVGNTAALTLVQQGGSSSDLTIGGVAGAAVLNLSGSGDVRVHAVTGALTLRKSGSGDLAVGDIEAPTVDVDDSGSGDVLLGRGSIGSLRVNLTGSGDFATAATSRDADLNAHGGGDMRVGPVTGAVRKNAGGGSDIRVGSSELVNSVIGEVAHAISSGDDKDDSSSHHSSYIIGHLAAFAIVVFIGFLILRIVRRAGGWPAVIRQGSQPAGPIAPSHPGVIALCDALSRTEQRLGRVEAYVTSREFDLQQKFREMGKS